MALGPEVVINTAAFHRVDECEDNLEKAFMVNAVAVGNLALVCREMDAVLMNLSTDYVFGGEKARATPYTEADTPWPMNVYGASKLAGEYLVRSLCPKHFVVRSCGLYGVAGSSGKGANFVELMLKLAREGKSIRVVDDQRLSPTSTATLAEQIIQLLQTSHYGLYHATSQGDCSWFEFSRDIFRLSGLTPDLSPQSTAQSGARAARPAYSVLENQALKSLGLDIMPPWQADLERYLEVRTAA
jgi:dTDP-4-dehydrorhamnose reductase